ncbi:MAG: hypothetical protein [Microvirus sp.]|nr:MAG: hypothetical protein [Microvirus sp.]
MKIKNKIINWIANYFSDQKIQGEKLKKYHNDTNRIHNNNMGIRNDNNNKKK